MRRTALIASLAVAIGAAAAPPFASGASVKTVLQDCASHNGKLKGHYSRKLLLKAQSEIANNPKAKDYTNCSSAIRIALRKGQRR
ncbi:MAG TPA: hypothetical protein VHE14_08835 [Solirubrobacteraceae bacterium]|nr:hypothetical protein [Solirubrobacteraceae bacterium]